jgi:hypothetical protein
VEGYALVKRWAVIRHRARPTMWGIDPEMNVLLVPSVEDELPSTEGVVRALAALIERPVDDLLGEIELYRVTKFS